MNSNSLQVFVIDDDDLVLRALAESIRSLGFEVETFSTPAPCIKALKTGRCNLLISDVNMPEMNGIDLVVRARELQPFLPVIVMTGYADVPLAVRAVQAGATQFVEKPLDEDTFLPLVNDTIDRTSAEDEAFRTALTEAEREVLRLVAEGKANKEIAFLLDKSIRTIENQRHRLCKKLDLASTADMVKVAVKLGLVPLTESRE